MTIKDCERVPTGPAESGQPEKAGPEAPGRAPEIDLSRCVVCEGCAALLPEIFHLNQAGYMEVLEHDQYPEDLVNEAMANCPEDCIHWCSRNRKGL